MLQNPCKTLGFMKNMVYKIPPGGGGKPYPASGLLAQLLISHNYAHLKSSVFSLDMTMYETQDSASVECVCNHCWWITNGNI